MGDAKVNFDFVMRMRISFAVALALFVLQGTYVMQGTYAMPPPAGWDQCGPTDSSIYGEPCYKMTTVGDKMAGFGTYYDFNCGNTSSPGVGCNAYGHPLCRTCEFHKKNESSHGQC